MAVKKKLTVKEEDYRKRKMKSFWLGWIIRGVLILVIVLYMIFRRGFG